MEEIINRLDYNLSSLRPDYYSELNEPLDDDQLDRLSADFKVKLPNDLRRLYKWKNGQKANCYASFVNNSIFVPLDEALSTASELTEMIGFDFEIEHWWNENWIPIFQNGGGDSICYDLKGVFTDTKGQLIEFWHADNDRNVIAPTLESFFFKINQFYESVQKEDFDEDFRVENIENYPIKYLLE